MGETDTLTLPLLAEHLLSLGSKLRFYFKDGNNPETVSQQERSIALIFFPTTDCNANTINQI